MASEKGRDNGIVYSTEYGTMCSACGNPKGQCVCRKNTTAGPSDGIVRVGRETKGRKGKGVTVIRGVPLDAAQLKKLTQELKAKCGCGGTVKGGVIEFQGDHRQRLIEELKSKGWPVKLSGG